MHQSAVRSLAPQHNFGRHTLAVVADDSDASHRGLVAAVGVDHEMTQVEKRGASDDFERTRVLHSRGASSHHQVAVVHEVRQSRQLDCMRRRGVEAAVAAAGLHGGRDELDVAHKPDADLSLTAIEAIWVTRGACARRSQQQ